MFFILFTIKSCTIYINERILVVKRLRYDRVRCIVAAHRQTSPRRLKLREATSGAKLLNNLTICLMPVVSQGGRAGAHP